MPPAAVDPREKDIIAEPLNPARILIVEDEEDLAELIDFRLKNERYHTQIATTGRQACGMAESFQPDCILLDIMLPEMDGWQVCRFIRDHLDPMLSSTPIIMLTALGDQDAKIKGLELGANSYIAKPYSIKEVLIICAKLITERRKHMQLQNEIFRLQSENRTSFDLQSLLCHELKNHLSFIQGFCSRLRKSTEDILPDNDKKYLGLIDRSASYLLNISEEVLLIRQVETGDFNLRRRPFNLKNSLDEVMRLYEQVAASKRITILSRYPAIETVDLNRGAFKLILSSLMENAVKYSSPETEIRCTVDLFGSGRDLVLRVEDQGAGIPLEEQAKVFDKYYRGKKHRESTKGTGIGLYAVKVLSESLQGLVELKSEEGRGSSFTVYLPLSAER
ncbi:MAG: response regulator [Deltaproteobacteria bacterium]|nr:response regulator [Deltaproteobacteria bacterium]